MSLLGKPWSEDERRSFLAGLEKLGKGDWKGIAKNFVPSRNSSQVASHAQKYYIRVAVTAEKKRRRASVFDIPLNQPYSQAVLGLSSNKVVQFSHQPSVSSLTHGFPTETVMPTVSWVPVVNFQSQSRVSISDVRGSLATYATFMAQPSVVALRQ